jgi:hypothetical protein
MSLPDTITITWHIEDVKELDDTLTDDEARQVLASFERNHDGSMMAMWEDLQYHVDEFNREKETK